ncbi:ATPase family associated with various cellular activities-domain-containing protein [Aspergillus floccosus]
MEIAQLPVLHVEARIKSSGDRIIVRTDMIRDEITKWLVDRFVVLSLGQEINSFEGLKEPHAQAIESIIVTECIGGNIESGAYRLPQVELDVQAYQLRTAFEEAGSQPTQQLEEPTDGEEDSAKGRVLMLPNKELDGLWESLILLWGPPGTGKTSLCRGLSQKLAIRLGKHYPKSKLIEINAPALASKFFGESSKMVAKAFETIEIILEEEDDTFVCVFVDEVETLAARRDRALSGNEPFDAVRAVNALLTGLDRLRCHPNVVTLCTSNIVTALDQAFLDRVDIKQYIPHLTNRAIYGIYKECLVELSRYGIIRGATFDVVQVDPTDPQTALHYVEQCAESLELPTFDDMHLNYQTFPHAVPRQLADVAAESVGLSGRTIRRLPALSLVLYSNSCGAPPVRDAIQALRMAITSERQAKAESHTDGK